MAIFSFPDRTLTGSFSGGSWSASLPLTNLANKLLSKVARSSNALAASTLIQVDLGATYNVRVISLCAHNITASGTVRIRGFSDSGYTTQVTGADSGTNTAFPAGFTATDVLNNPKNYTYVFSTYKAARYWKIEITDTGNAAGYLELGRLWLGEANFEPAVGVSYGASLGYESRDVIEETLGGIPWADKRAPRRSFTGKLDVLTDAEKRNALVMQKVLTESDEVFYVTDAAASAANIMIESFPAFMRKPSPLSYPYYNNFEMPFQLIEQI